MINFGHMRIFQNTEPRECRQCKEDIPKYEYYIRIIGRSTGGKWMSSCYHKNCLMDKINDRINYAIENPKVKGKHTKQHVVNTLSEDTRIRRHILQKMLSANDIPRLLEAYNKQSTRRVLRAYELIATRWAELHAMQIPFRTTLIASEPDKWRPKDKALFDALVQWDSHWVDRLTLATEPAEKINLMMTRSARGDLPTFPEDDRMEVQEKGVSHGQDEPADSAVPDVPVAPGLSDLQHRTLSLH